MPAHSTPGSRRELGDDGSQHVVGVAAAVDDPVDRLERPGAHSVEVLPLEGADRVARGVGDRARAGGRSTSTSTSVCVAVTISSSSGSR